MTPIETVLKFFNAMQMRDFNTAVALVTEDVVYDNKPLATLHGRRRFNQFLRPWVEMHDDISILVSNIVASGEMVIVERIDRDRKGAGPWISTQAAGFFRVRDGQIAEWRDYYDLNTSCLQNGGDYFEYVKLAQSVADAP